MGPEWAERSQTRPPWRVIPLYRPVLHPLHDWNAGEGWTLDRDQSYRFPLRARPKACRTKTM